MSKGGSHTGKWLGLSKLYNNNRIYWYCTRNSVTRVISLFVLPPTIGDLALAPGKTVAAGLLVLFHARLCLLYLLLSSLLFYSVVYINGCSEDKTNGILHKYSQCI